MFSYTYCLLFGWQVVNVTCKILDVKSRTICMPKENSDLKLVARNVAHFYVGLPG